MATRQYMGFYRSEFFLALPQGLKFFYFAIMKILLRKTFTLHNNYLRHVSY